MQFKLRLHGTVDYVLTFCMQYVMRGGDCFRFLLFSYVLLVVTVGGNACRCVRPCPGVIVDVASP
jgi:hypothetical protein